MCTDKQNIIYTFAKDIQNHKDRFCFIKNVVDTFKKTNNFNTSMKLVVENLVNDFIEQYQNNTEQKQDQTIRQEIQTLQEIKNKNIIYKPILSKLMVNMYINDFEVLEIAKQFDMVSDAINFLRKDSDTIDQCINVFYKSLIEFCKQKNNSEDNENILRFIECINDLEDRAEFKIYREGLGDIIDKIYNIAKYKGVDAPILQDKHMQNNQTQRGVC